ncbi:helix-turn-helix domain-containing protein [Tianweitania sediminis]|uniref:Helix-turn-helix transcriptional regulator n=1 Tax=Tianweitania sediminis TaxID=1502156 RepID=A0A8J7QX88_9HYPH|nr:AraC family transcriptional regulator [Tianweitania sediminis]MBP0437345.1 helix-turn-helix transcriptional regulator [Tianweitania sediminis]
MRPTHIHASQTALFSNAVRKNCEETYRTYADFYQQSAYGLFPQQHRSVRGTLQSSLILVEQERHELADPPIDELVVSTPLRSACSYEWNMGLGWQTGSSRTGDLIVVPPGTGSRWRAGGDRRLIILAIPVPLVQKLVGPDCPSDLASSFAPLAGASGEDPYVAGILHRLWEISSPGKSQRRSTSDDLIQALIFHLLERAAPVQPTGTVSAFSARDWLTLEAYVDAHLHGNLPVLDLAGVTGWSQRHFARIFRQSKGQTPHDWIVAKRVDRAKALLGERDLSLAEIALCCGFADQSHFTTSFRKLTGFTPLRWRRAQV